MKTLLASLILILILTSACEARGRRSSSVGTVDTTQEVVDKAPVRDIEHALLKKVNEVRKQYGLAVLVLKVELLHQARRHCGWMARSGRMVHSNDRVAENIAMGQADVDDVMSAWMSSSGHRANILNPGYEYIGLTRYKDGSGTPFWCQQFE